MDQARPGRGVLIVICIATAWLLYLKHPLPPWMLTLSAVSGLLGAILSWAWARRRDASEEVRFVLLTLCMLLPLHAAQVTPVGRESGPVGWLALAEYGALYGAVWLVTESIMGALVSDDGTAGGEGAFLG